MQVVEVSKAACCVHGLRRTTLGFSCKTWIFCVTFQKLDFFLEISINWVPACPSVDTSTFLYRRNSISTLSSNSSSWKFQLHWVHFMWKSSSTKTENSPKHPLTLHWPARERKPVWKIVCHKNFTRGDHNTVKMLFFPQKLFSSANRLHSMVQWFLFAGASILPDVVFSLTKHFSTSSYFLFILLRQ